MEASGSGYEDYIRILLFLEDKAVRNYRMMDVIQWNVRKKQKDFSTDACACEVDRQGRILIPSVLREFAKLEKDVVLVGVGSRIEIWNKAFPKK